MVIPVGLLGAQQLVVAEKGSERQGHNEGNYAGTVFGARGIRPACIPGILIKTIADEEKWCNWH